MLQGEERKETPPAPTRPTIWNAVAEGDWTRVEAKLAAGALIDEADSEGGYQPSPHPMEGRDDVDPLVGY